MAELTLNGKQELEAVYSNFDHELVDEVVEKLRRLVNAALDAEGRMYENAHIEETELIDAALALQELLTPFPTKTSEVSDA